MDENYEENVSLDKIKKLVNPSIQDDENHYKLSEEEENQ